MKENYQFKDEKLVVSDPELEIVIEERFAPRLLPEKLEPSEALVVKRNSEGKLLCAYFEQEGVLEGQYCFYYPNGRKSAECFYFSGKLHGPSRVYTEEGQCISGTWFYQDRREGKAKRYYRSGKLCSLERYKQGVFHTKQEYYYEEGTLKSVIPYREGCLEGQVLLYWPTGQKKRECHFQKGMRSGWDRLWDPQGILLDAGSYEKGEATGKHQRFFQKGEIQEERLYHSPSRFDVKEWDNLGNLILEGTFHSSLHYTEKTWKEGVEEKREGIWKEGRICWGSDVN